MQDTVICLHVSAQSHKAGSTLSASQPVPQASTRRALHRLTSEVERDPAHSVRYGRQRAKEAISLLLQNKGLGFRTRNKHHSCPSPESARSVWLWVALVWLAVSGLEVCMRLCAL